MGYVTWGVVGLVLCSLRWRRYLLLAPVVPALIVLALMADNLEIAEDPDAVWGVAAREILGPFKIGLVGLMLACLIAALMSSADCYMLIVSALVVRNFYAAYVRPDASEKECVLMGRIVGVLVIAGGVVISLCFMNIFEQLGFDKEEAKELELKAMLHVCTLKALNLTKKQMKIGRVSTLSSQELANLLLDILS